MFGGSSKPAARAAPAAPARAAAPAAAPHAPASHAPVPAAAPAGGVPAVAGAARPQGLLGTVMEGMAFGTGSAIAHRAVGALVGSFSGGSDKPADAGAPAQAEAAAPQSAVSYGAGAGRQDCTLFQRDFTRCLQENKNDIGACQGYLDTLTQCQQDARLA